jgi:hypothetical protein
MQSPLHLIQHVIVGTSQDDGTRVNNLGSLNKNEFVIRDSLLDDLVGKSERRGLESLFALEIGERGDESCTGCFCDTAEILFATSANSHSTGLDELLETEIVDSLGSQNDVGACGKNLADTLESDLGFADRSAMSTTMSARNTPLADFLELVRVIDGDMYSKMHALLSEVDIEARNLGASDAGLHG